MSIEYEQRMNFKINMFRLVVYQGSIGEGYKEEVGFKGTSG